MQTISIDGMKLKALILSKADGMAEASRVCGFGEGYFSGCASKGKIAKYGAQALEREYGIKPEEYARAAKKAEISQTEIMPEASDAWEADVKLNRAELRAIVMMGIVDAMLHLISTGKFQAAIVDAIRKANDE